MPLRARLVGATENAVRPPVSAIPPRDVSLNQLCSLADAPLRRVIRNISPELLGCAARVAPTFASRVRPLMRGRRLLVFDACRRVRQDPLAIVDAREVVLAVASALAFAKCIVLPEEQRIRSGDYAHNRTRTRRRSN